MTTIRTDSLEASVLKFSQYLDDFNTHGGGFMRNKYGDDPMKGFANVVERFRPIVRQALSSNRRGE